MDAALPANHHGPMPAYAPITPSTRFTVGQHVETEVFDLKLKFDEWAPVDIAAHVAQLANHLGGALLIGAKEEGGRIGRFELLDAAGETAVRRKVSEAVEQHCVPPPLIELVPVEHEKGKYLVGVNVPTVLGGVVGVRIKTDTLVAGSVDGAF